MKLQKILILLTTISYTIQNYEYLNRPYTNTSQNSSQYTNRNYFSPSNFSSSNGYNYADNSSYNYVDNNDYVDYWKDSSSGNTFYYDNHYESTPNKTDVGFLRNCGFNGWRCRWRNRYLGRY